eukprot:jgi/Picre1/34782/NNA_002248.t1
MKVALALRAAAATLTAHNISRLRNSSVAQWELRLRTVGNKAAWRVIVSVPTGHESGEDCVDVYREHTDGTRVIYNAITGDCPMNNVPVSAPYEPLETLQLKQMAARRHKTTYCYDFPAVFEHALMQVWAQRAASGEPDAVPPTSKLVEAQELVPRDEESLNFRESAPLVPMKRPPNLNKVGVVAWLMTLHTPEYPQGRQIVTIANDITHSFGAFGPKEDAMFRAATDFALENRLPVVYLAANSGARVGLANELKLCMKVAWMIDDEGEVRYQLSDIIGLEDGLGVECLSGSGSIAGIYSKAFKEGFTLTLVSGRTVGIGAYLARLGRRCIQRKDQPIILTGFAALNKLLAERYTQATCSWEVQRSWARMTIPKLPTSDSITRRVAYKPADGEKLNPRSAIAGYDDAATGGWVSGLFDRGSWLESQSGWARTVVTGRARLGGIPCGVIAVEVDTVMLDIPADPGMPDSSEKTIPQAGQVWFPDSALKTAHAMEEFDLEGLPLFVMANWRGFSGGQRDLFEGVLQAGSLIVENLRSYRQPVFMYIPPGCELRGGAWVVIDSQINPDQIESYADTTANGGVLEPEGMVEIKFRSKELISAMHRLDPVMKALVTSHGADHSLVKEREAKLLPIYTGIAQSFAQMHDTPVRMQAKGVIKEIVPWETSRQFFANRLKRRLAEAALCTHLRSADDKITSVEAKQMIRDWFLTSPLSGNADSNISLVVDHAMNLDEQEALWQDDAAFMDWVDGPSGAARISLELRHVRQQSATKLVKALSSTSEGTQGLMQGLEEAMETNHSLLLQLRNLVNQRG